MKTQTYSSFKDMARALHAQDVARADKLRRSAPLRKNKTRTTRGPAIAR